MNNDGHERNISFFPFLLDASLQLASEKNTRRTQTLKDITFKTRLSHSTYRGHRYLLFFSSLAAFSRRPLCSSLQFA
jgi:hypothetical protein